MTPGEKKNYLRLALAGLYVVSMVVVYSSGEDAVWWFWVAALVIVIMFYKVILATERCPACYETFVLEPVEKKQSSTVYTCSSCGSSRTRRNGPGH